MTLHPERSAWSNHRDARPLSKPSFTQGDDVLDGLDIAINERAANMDFAQRCRFIVARAVKRGAASHAPEVTQDRPQAKARATVTERDEGLRGSPPTPAKGIYCR